MLQVDTDRKDISRRKTPVGWSSKEQQQGKMVSAESMEWEALRVMKDGKTPVSGVSVQ